MFLKKIELENFRNYSSCEIDFHEKINIITGENAQGKTNLLESIYFSSFIRSFRTSSDKEMISFGKDHLRVCSSYSKNGETDLVEVAMDRSGRKIAKINGARQERLRDVVSDYYVVVFSPEDMKIVKEEPERRRNFLDREICQMSLSYFESLAVYKKLLLQRNSYLKDEKIDEALLDIWDESLAKEGAKIIEKRKIFIDKLSLISENIHRGITERKQRRAGRVFQRTSYGKQTERYDAGKYLPRSSQRRSRYYDRWSKHKEIRIPGTAEDGCSFSEAC